MRKFHSLAGGRDSREQVVPLCVVSEAQYEFVHYLVFADGARDGRHLRIFGDLVYEVLTVKAADSFAPETSRHDRNAVHIGFGDHCFHRGVNVKIGRLSCDVPVAERTEIGKLMGLWRQTSAFLLWGCS